MQENIPASAARVALFDTIAAILAARHHPAMATTGAKLDQGGPGLLHLPPEPHHLLNAGRYVDRDYFLRSRSLRRDDLLLNLYEAPIATVQEKLHLIASLPAQLSVSSELPSPVNPGHRLRLDGFSPSTSALSVPDSPESCSSGYSEKTMQKRRSTKVAKRNFQNGLYRCAAIFIFRYVLVLILGIALGGIG